jgi:hypothetical protein
METDGIVPFIDMAGVRLLEKRGALFWGSRPQPRRPQERTCKGRQRLPLAIPEIYGGYADVVRGGPVSSLRLGDESEGALPQRASHGSQTLQLP